jgi:hypothetical protein
MQKFFLIVADFISGFLIQPITNTAIVKTNIEQYAAGFPQEKMYLQFDKPVYAPGETIGSRRI